LFLFIHYMINIATIDLLLRQLWIQNFKIGGRTGNSILMKVAKAWIWTSLKVRFSVISHLHNCSSSQINVAWGKFKILKINVSWCIFSKKTILLRAAHLRAVFKFPIIFSIFRHPSQCLSFFPSFSLDSPWTPPPVLT
jgi:hypothetical protein